MKKSFFCFALFLFAGTGIVFAGGNNEKSTYDDVEFVEDNISYTLDNISYITDDIQYINDDIQYLEEHIILLNNLSNFKIIEYGTDEYESSIKLLSLLYENASDAIGSVEAIISTYVLIQTGGLSGFLMPLYGVPTTIAAAKALALDLGKRTLQTTTAAAIVGATGTLVDWAKDGKVENGTFIEWYSEGMKWISLIQTVDFSTKALSAIEEINAFDEPLIESSRKIINSSKTDLQRNPTHIPGAKTTWARKRAEKLVIKTSPQGYPNFKPYAKAIYTSDSVLPVKKEDAFKLANKSTGITEKDLENYVWHHSEDGKSLYLVSRDIHDVYRHSGGDSLISQYYNLFSK